MSISEDALGAIKQVLDVPQHIFIDSSQSLRDLQPNSSCRSVWAKKTMLQAQAQVVQSRKFLFRKQQVQFSPIISQFSW